MKGKILESAPNNILVLCSNHTFKCGGSVTIEDATKGTNPQNRFFHELVKIWVASGCHSYEGDYNKVRDFIKRDLGAGFEKYFYTADDLKAVKVNSFDDIPEHIQKDKRRIMGQLKSWADYGKKERMKTIQNLIDNMIQSGVNSKEFDNICKEFTSV